MFFTQEPSCLGFTIRRETGLCRFYSSRHETDSNQIQYGITAYAWKAPTLYTVAVTDP